ncbi:N-acetyl-D-glucosamine ABC transport system, sugar-binding protein [Lachnospiraceae bacterium KM106-2]|nr:N-acetyl-D-glucosamine ABC transport system, sugar-binding protein [Lachnospiraceae bacterium KM106-2]
MRKKLLSIFLCIVMAVTMLTGCGGKSTTTGKDGGSKKEDTKKDDEKPTATPAVTTVGEGTPLEMWTFVELHSKFYAKMVDKWNKENPDKKVKITFTTYPYADMHNKLTMALQTGEGAPDLCDVEIGQFPNFTKDTSSLYPLDDAIKPYQDKLVKARLDIYSKDGKIYGAPTHVGATVMYYNTKILKQYGIDYTKIKTWDDYAAAGEKLKKASNGKVMMTSVDTASVDWMWIAMSEYGEDWTTTKDGKANVQLKSVKKMLNMQAKWLKDKIAMVSPGGHVDMEEGFANIGDGKIASFPKALWYMSRFLSYMPEMKGQWAIAPCPVFEEGQPRSVGIGGTGTIVTQQSKNAKLAAEFIAYAKCSEEGEKGIWNELGFDVCNTSIWNDESITKDKTNKYLQYFVTNPFDVLNEVKDEIGKINVKEISTTINSQMCDTTLNEIFEDGVSVDDALQEAQDAVDSEQ